MNAPRDADDRTPQPDADDKGANVQKVMKQTGKEPAEAGNDPGGAHEPQAADASTQPEPSTAPADPEIARRGG